MKIDLHLHSLASSQNGDSIQWLGDNEVIGLIYKQGYKMISFTDHSVFDYKKYISMRDYAKGAITLLPGIEVNVKTKRGDIGNILYIFPETLSDDQLKEISDICIKNLLKNGISFEKANTLFAKFDTLLIPHVGKSDYLEYEDLCKIKYAAVEVTNMNHSNYKKFRKLEPKPYSTVSFSDTHIWSSFPQVGKLITMMPELKEPTFKELKRVLKLHKVFSERRIYD